MRPQVLLALASGGMETRALSRANWAAVPATLPVLSLAFVYQNVVPVIASNLEVRDGEPYPMSAIPCSPLCPPAAFMQCMSAPRLTMLPHLILGARQNANRCKDRFAARNAARKRHA